MRFLSLKNNFEFSDHSFTRIEVERWQDSMSRGQKSWNFVTSRVRRSNGRFYVLFHGFMASAFLPIKMRTEQEDRGASTNSSCCLNSELTLPTQKWQRVYNTKMTFYSKRFKVQNTMVKVPPFRLHWFTSIFWCNWFLASEIEKNATRRLRRVQIAPIGEHCYGNVLRFSLSKYRNWPLPQWGFQGQWKQMMKQITLLRVLSHKLFPPLLISKKKFLRTRGLGQGFNFMRVFDIFAMNSDPW